MHRLALALGRTVGELERSMTERELVDWYRFAAFWPLPDHLADAHAAMICTLVANIARPTDSAPILPDQFLVLRGERTAPAQDVDDERPVPTEAERFKLAIGG